MGWRQKRRQRARICHGGSRKAPGKKRAAALGLVLLFFVFTLTQLKLYKDEILPVKGNSVGKTQGKLFLYDGIKVEQDLAMEHGEDNYLDIDIRNPALRGNNGEMVFLLSDREGQTVQKTVLRTRLLKKKQKYRFKIGEQVKPGERYTLLIRTQGVAAAKGMALVLTAEESRYFSPLRVNGTERSDGSRLRIRLMHPGWNSRSIAVMFGAFLAVFLLIFAPIHLPDPWNRLLMRLLFLATPLVCFVIVEKTCKYKIFDMKQPALNLNLWIYAMVLLLFYLIANRMRLASVLTVCLSYGMALINYFVSYFRGTVFVPADITAAGTAANVIHTYSFQITSNVLWGGIAVMCFLACLYKLRSCRGMGVPLRLLALCAYGVLLAVFLNLFYKSDSLEEWKVHYKAWNPAVSYEKNGFAVCFVVGSRYLIPEKPQGYSLEKVADKARPYQEQARKQEADGADKPNIIAIMDEAFSDLSYDGELPLSQDAMPFVRGLKENTVKGNLHVTSFGGRTANTEYEFLTGLSMAFFPGGTVPYEHQINRGMDSLTTILKGKGYRGMIALHPFKGSGYNRENAYPLLGFEQFLTQEDFVNPKLLRSYISDQADFEKITELYEASKRESEDPFYLFSVTMQNHGGYGEDYDNLPLDIAMEDGKKEESVQRYLNLVKKTDEAFQWLTDYFKERKDPTVIVLFGDHQPKLPDEFYASLIGESEINRLEGKAKQYVVPFVIWANYDIQEEEVEMISANYLSAKVCQVAGLSLTPFQCFLTEMEKEIPVITGNYYIAKDGKIRELSHREGYEEWIDTYQLFQYNQVYDDKVISDFFCLP